MNRDSKVVIVDTNINQIKDPLGATAIFDDSDVEDGDDPLVGGDEKKEIKPPGPIKRFFINNRGWLISIGVLLLTIVALSLTIYFINIKCNTTVNEERDRANRLINEYEEQSNSVTAARDKYCEEAQRLRSQLRELSEEYDRLKSSPPPKAVNKFQQKKILQDYNNDGIGHEKSKKHRKVEFVNDDEGISVELPKPSNHASREIEEAVTLDSLNGASNMDTVVTTQDDEFDTEVIEM